MSRLHDVHALGQSMWLDYIRRHLLRSGELSALVEQGLRGITSNPAIFEKAIDGSTDYDDAVARMADRTAGEIYEQLAVEDIRAAADVLRPVFESADRNDGFVSLEVSPLLAHDTAATVEEGFRLWRRVERENLMIKVPATHEGIPAITELLARGVNVNVTLLFSREVFERVTDAYMSGLELFVARGGDLRRIASVASFFVSRVDHAVDRQLEACGVDTQLVGKTAVANAKLAYQDWKHWLHAPRWQTLAKLGARPQRLLWASTSTKDPRLPDVYYVDQLIGPDTVDTVPLATLDAFLDHGRAEPTLEAGIDEAHAVIAALPDAGINLTALTEQLLAEGVDSFRQSFERLLAAVDKKRRSAHHARMQEALPNELTARVEHTLTEWDASHKLRRLWARDARLWTGYDEGKWLDWLGVADREGRDEADHAAFAAHVVARGFTHVAVLGMGGASLSVDVLARTFGPQPGHPRLAVLDSTDPAQIRTFEQGLDLATTLFVVSSKSGTTLEPNLLADYFYARVREIAGERAGDQFVAITDPGSPLIAVADERGYWKRFFGEPGIGGRYSALSEFGMVPAAVMGVDVAAFIERAEEMVHACASCVPPRDVPAVWLGVTLGEAAKVGRDKVTIVASPPLVHVGAWIEQLLAESTGKGGRGLVPIDREPLGPPAVYGSDRLFVYLRYDPEPGDERAINALERAGQPVVRLHVASLDDLGQLFFLWELATAVAGSVLHINPFDQPDVDASKLETRRLMREFESNGTFGPEDESPCRSLAELLRSLHPGTYFAMLAYIEDRDAHRAQLQRMRTLVRDARRVATTVGFGPRFLHSSGQLHKGGPNTGVFLQIVSAVARDVPVPGKRYTFGVVKAAQERGDFKILLHRGRPIYRVYLSADVEADLRALAEAVETALV